MPEYGLSKGFAVGRDAGDRRSLPRDGAWDCNGLASPQQREARQLPRPPRTRHTRRRPEAVPVGGGRFGNAGIEVNGTPALVVGTWAHLALTYDGAALRLYVNGVQVASRTGNLLTSANPLQIGGDSIHGQYFSGIIDEVRIFNRARTAAEIQGDMQTPIASFPLRVADAGFRSTASGQHGPVPPSPSSRTTAVALIGHRRES